MLDLDELERRCQNDGLSPETGAALIAEVRLAREEDNHKWFLEADDLVRSVDLQRQLDEARTALHNARWSMDTAHEERDAGKALLAELAVMRETITAERLMAQDDSEHLRTLLAELLNHDVRRYGHWTASMQDRVRAALRRPA